MAFPDRLPDVERLIEQHRQLEHQTLLLALYYGPDDGGDSVYLLEIITPFGYNEISLEQDLFEMQYGSTPGFSVPPGERLSILLTNAVEAEAAVRQQWPAIMPVLDAVRRGNYRVLYVEGEGRLVLDQLRQNMVAA